MSLAGVRICVPVELFVGPWSDRLREVTIAATTFGASELGWDDRRSWGDLALRIVLVYCVLKLRLRIVLRSFEVYDRVFLAVEALSIPTFLPLIPAF